MKLYNQDQSPEETEVLNRISKHVPIKPRIDAVMDILYLGMKIICSHNKIAPELVIDRPRFKRMKWDTIKQDDQKRCVFQIEAQ